MGVLLGLLTALTWGSSDFLARFATHRIGTLRSMLYMQLFGFFFLSFLLPWFGGFGHLADGSGWQPWAWGALAGFLNSISMLAMYRSFEVGKMTVVAPVSASYPALTVLLSFFTGEHLTFWRGAGVACTLLGAVLVAGGEKSKPATGEDAAHSRSKGIGWAICSAVGLGFLFWLLGGRIIPRVGAVQTVWMIRLTSIVITITVIYIARQPMRLPRTGVRWMTLGMGVLDSSAFVLSNRGMQMEQVAVVSVLGSLYGAVTVGLAAIFLREHVSRLQWFGIVTIFAGIFLIGK